MALTGPVGPSGPAGPAGRQAATLVDGADTRVGPILYAFELPAYTSPPAAFADALVDHQTAGGLAAFGVDVGGRATGRVVFPDAGCTGTPLVDAPNLLPVLQVVNDTVFVPDAAAPPTLVRSIETPDLSRGCTGITPRGGCCTDTSATSPQPGLFSATATTLQALGLRQPFRVRGR